MSLQDRERAVSTITQAGIYLVECGPSFTLIATDDDGKATLWAKAKGTCEPANLSLEPYTQRLRELARLRRGATQECRGLVFAFDGPPPTAHGSRRKYERQPTEASQPVVTSQTDPIVTPPPRTDTSPIHSVKPKRWADLFK